MKARTFHNQSELIYESQIIQGQLWIHFNGETICIDLEEGTRRSGAKSGASDEIRAPMPGKVTQIRRGPNESVQAGEVVVVMEAMKMEYNLKAEVSGTLSEIKVQVGQQVALGSLLARISSP